MDKINTKRIDKKLEKFDNRGIQTLFRTLSRNHYNLLKMVDNKAGIIITINSIIISLAMGSLYVGTNKVQANIEIHQIRYLIRSSIISMTIAVVSMLPHRYIGKRFRNSNYKGTLYAQNFSGMTLTEFKNNLYDVMETGYKLYDEMINDLYFLGQIISYKQKMVMASFMVFLLGLFGALLFK